MKKFKIGDRVNALFFPDQISNGEIVSINGHLVTIKREDNGATNTTAISLVKEIKEN